MSYLRYLCLFAYIVVPNTYCVEFFVCFVFCLVHPMLPVSLDYPFLIAPSVFSNVYFDAPGNPTYKLTTSLRPGF
jgi:hypothetical protein